MTVKLATVTLIALALSSGLVACSSGGGSGDTTDAGMPTTESPSASPTEGDVQGVDESVDESGEGPVDESIPELEGPSDSDTPSDEEDPADQTPADDEPVQQRPGVISTDDVRPFRPDGAYADVLKDCVLVNTIAASCTLETLPFIGQINPQPTVEDVLQRTLVTHDWMGERFAEVLRAAPADLLPLFASTTSVLIGSEVRPSFYTGLNGGIQLDPAFLWQSVEEKQTISIEQDFRTDFGSALRFESFRRGVVNGRPASRFFSLEDDSTREFPDLQLNIMRLLYHELGHANDFLPSTAIAELDSQKKVADALDENFRFWLSPQLESTLPLNSDVIKEAAQVRFRDLDADEEIAALTAADMGLQFADDGALDFYSYFTIREDLATLLEYTMMSINYGLELNIAFVDKIEETDDTVCADYLVGWGARSRQANRTVAERARWVVENVYGMDPGVSEFFDRGGLGSEQLMTPGVDWCTNNEPQNTSLAESGATPGLRSTGQARRSAHQMSVFELQGDRALR